MKKIILNCEIPQQIIDHIKTLYNYDIIYCDKYEHFDNAVAAHPDMNYLKIGNKLFTINDVQKNEWNNNTTVKKYPYDVVLNALCMGKDLICKKNSVSKIVLDFAIKNNYNIIDVKQGYVKCNIAVVDYDRKAIITEDKGIAKTLLEYGYDVLLLNCHAVRLEPYDYGFIGGSSGNIDGKLLFTGNINKHPEAKRIRDFCEKYDTEIISLSDDILYDYGSILLIEE